MAEFLTIAHEVADFDLWKAAYDADAPRRAAAGLSQLLRLRDREKPHLVSLLFAVEDPERALAAASSPELAERMRLAGVIGAPFVTLRVGAFTPAPAATYMTMNFKVGDIETFRTAYASDAAAREAASLTDLAVLQRRDDPNNLFLIWSVGDAAKAEQFLGSPELADRQLKNAGVVNASISHFWTPA